MTEATQPDLSTLDFKTLDTRGEELPPPTIEDLAFHKQAIYEAELEAEALALVRKAESLGVPLVVQTVTAINSTGLRLNSHITSLEYVPELLRFVHTLLEDVYPLGPTGALQELHKACSGLIQRTVPHGEGQREVVGLYEIIDKEAIEATPGVETSDAIQ